MLNVTVKNITESANPEENWDHHNSLKCIKYDSVCTSVPSLRGQWGRTKNRTVIVYCPVHRDFFRCKIPAADNTCIYQTLVEPTEKKIYVYDKPKTMLFHGMQINIELNEQDVNIAREALNWSASLKV